MTRYSLYLALPLLTLFSGCWQSDVGRSFYPDGSIKTEATVHNGLLDGPAVMYFESGVKMSEAFYVGGVLHGITISYHENGRVKGQAEYNLGVLHGKSGEWTKEGVLINSVRFDSGRVLE